MDKPQVYINNGNAQTNKYIVINKYTKQTTQTYKNSLCVCAAARQIGRSVLPMPII